MIPRRHQDGIPCQVNPIRSPASPTRKRSAARNCFARCSACRSDATRPAVRPCAGSRFDEDAARVVAALDRLGLGAGVKAVAATAGGFTPALHPNAKLGRVLYGPWTEDADAVCVALGAVGFSIDADVAVQLTRPSAEGE